ncbi:rho-related GTP-binding protein RhoF isoform X1 [Gadus morhua]|uniref:Ras homolog family member F n=1 Tax=Gadus morhua TaxID=8049 RepID=A0A8C4ZWR8_GADMO|nr:rho-related GTP-binding protein RhoF isoform X1 [Gadus morhua]XP_056444546.1 rho-related GTP-binding protein RhoF isoform X1 [Gadus chalcogrammus]XP_059906029.1 rho-related GTP-binding protein RhoF isoform X1 [Gadus macrocephalus]
MAQNGAVASNETVKIHEELKIVIVGDGGCGKTSLLMVYAKGDFPEKYAPSVFEKYVTTITHGGKNIRLNLYDTAGQDDYDRLRPLSYQEAHLIMVCYDVTNPTSFENVLIKWHPELKHFCKDIPVILIGCKTDLRKDKERIRKLKAVDQTPITYTQGEDVRQQMNAELYLECSAKHQENVEQVFQETTKTALEACRKARKRKRKRLCVAM